MALTTVLIDHAQESGERLKSSNVTLESLVVYCDSNTRPAIIGRTKVANLGYEKSVFARLTFDDWATYRDYSAAYLESCEENDERFDIFGFGFLRNDKSSKNGQFVLSCIQDGIQYWDNNNGNNYHFCLNEEIVGLNKPDLFATNWQAKENGEIIVEESDYQHFQPHPLTPTKLRFYSTIANAPEKEIVPTKAKDAKHMYAYHDIAFECMQDLYEDSPKKDECLLLVKASEECCAPSGEETNSETGLPVDQNSVNLNDIQEGLITSEQVVKQVAIEDDIFDKLEKKAAESKIDYVADIEHENVNGEVAAESNSDATGDGEDTTAIKAANPCAEEGDVKTPAKDGTKLSRSSDATYSYQQDDGTSMNKEAIENEETPRSMKKSLLSKFCCGKAEND